MFVTCVVGGEGGRLTQRTATHYIEKEGGCYCVLGVRVFSVRFSLIALNELFIVFVVCFPVDELQIFCRKPDFRSPIRSH